MKEFSTVEKQWDILFALCEDEVLFSATNGSISKWGVGEQLSHVAMALVRIGKNVTTSVHEESETPGEGPNKMGHLILKLGYIPRGKGQAPNYVIPADQPDRNQVKEELIRAQAIWTMLKTSKDVIQASKHVVPHHLLGDFIPAHWVRFAGVHTKHHLKIIFDILQANGLKTPKKSEAAFTIN